MKFAAITLLTLLPATVASAPSAGPLHKNQIKSLVTFGDSYTDIVAISNGGTQWPVYAAGYAGVQLFPFARSGATCSNDITFRPFPPVFGSQIPAFLSSKENGTIKVDPQSTLYTLWIGTNDVGVSSLLTGGNSASIVDVAGCMVNWVQVMYNNGARNFLFQNMIPLETIPLYSPNSWPDKYWHIQRNTTEWSIIIRELVLSGNALIKLMLQALAPKLTGAHVAGVFDSHSLFTDMHNNPANYFNGTAPFNVTGAVTTCVFQLGDSDESVCTVVNGTDRDSYLWFNELHPSEQSDRHVAREIANIIQGIGSRWVSWLS
ncbi:carbohydrate esterase family 16 protein [Macrolepiota fuliginosa MF-IS2]|uniref:Carbohydrate esterase family 16 protein n=1 Tax=Macrolepiota fuliginosa MF-IS2 TaxID=1400762 RepID=A0A9P5XFD1_9AGAR|nr:carbohydrate esterase family 16 protein [Macrolepiota fuliginosa MF-IS2]